MAYANLNNESETILTDNDTIAIVKVIDTLRGGRTLDVSGYAGKIIKAGHVIIKDGSGNHKPMPATDFAASGVATTGTVVPGTGYTNGTYENVPLSGGTGSGALATIVIASTVLSTVTITKKGTGYTAADSLTFDNAYVGGTGTGASVPVATVSDTAAAYGSLPASHSYVGILTVSILASKPFAAIMIRGVVNPTACPIPIASIQSAFDTATKNAILFVAD